MRLQNTMVNAVASENGYFALFTLQDVTEISRRLEQYIAMRNQALSEVEERRRAEQEIREREALYRSIFEKNRAVAGVTSGAISAPPCVASRRWRTPRSPPGTTAPWRSGWRRA